MTTIIINIKELLQVRETSISKVSGADMAVLPTIKNAFLVIEDNIIADFGSMENLPEINAETIIDATGKMVLPSWCDSHTHIVYAGNREQEFVDRINGMTYEEIANRGGGILNSAKKLNETTEEEIYDQSKARLEEVMRLGTGAVEIKSGYGLTFDGELKMLRVIQRLSQNYPITIKATFLGAHAFPLEYAANHKGYIDSIINEMLPEIAKNKLANFIDVFCETGYFTVDETQQIMEAGIHFGLKPKIHVNQFNSIGGIQAGIKYNALSVDHLEVMKPEDIEALKNTETMPVALPSCSYFLSIPYTPAREMIAAGLPLALATDYNPGSTPSGNMNFVVATACIKMKMTPEEAINAATINGAYAMGISDTHGSITIGKKANLIITKPIPSYYQLPYAFASNLIDAVLIEGEIFE
ncbi:imidazolonepropionase [Flavobacterium gawalongense]|uniref:Imidazolonepropionase n=1 Tax=Flavobacterium gawalongense TaxID=2594432 RepID=A0A553BLD4_9FLAO|nr:imidazolonepropionase [Flavobacterium gawalongense]TRX00861.1 imidazolonepropionase [Flavobacterium gawalongense]TRX05162.1 imidazolonepropionase [Flavobacterium gawalongense]TRX09059.1 imidazolonepropionase [Flavobacterium gawalongense]TRX10194.1 imidazolonepropionase [Flavobacterium gawalongense]TRX27138.1 imidazolonepropionase [Flavobacterium gawalongense]